jgi:hypothetical protein
MWRISRFANQPSQHFLIVIESITHWTTPCLLVGRPRTASCTHATVPAAAPVLGKAATRLPWRFFPYEAVDLVKMAIDSGVPGGAVTLFQNDNQAGLFVVGHTRSLVGSRVLMSIFARGAEILRSRAKKTGVSLRWKAPAPTNNSGGRFAGVRLSFRFSGRRVSPVTPRFL